jgi:hypothetical protein
VALILLAFACAAIVFSGCEKTVTETEYVEVPGSCTGQLYSWKSVWPPLTTNDYHAVYGSDESHIFAVGNLGGIAAYNGSTWSRTSAGFTGGFRDIWSNSPTSGYAVGEVGIYKYDGTSWSPVFNAGAYYYTCLWGSDVSDVWCGGTSMNFISHWNGTSWSNYDLGSYQYFYDMWGTASNDIYAVGQSGITGQATVWHYDGTTWSDVTPPGLTNVVFSSVWGSAGNDVYVAGTGSTIRRWNGSSWGAMNTTGLPSNQEIRAIRGRSGNDIYLANFNAVYHYNGSSWTDTNVNTLESYSYIEDLWIGPTKLFAAGESGTIVTYDGAVWHNENGGPYRNLYDVWTGGPQEAVAVGSNGVILAYDGASVTEVSLPGMQSDLYNIAGSRDNLWAVGGGGKVLHYDGSAWSDISDVGVVAGTLMDVWASGNEAVAVGYGGNIIRISGTTLTAMTSGTGETLFGVWGTATNDIFAVGYNGTILHYNGTSWSPMDNGGIDDHLVSITGSASNDVYAIGSRGFLLHYNGSSWESTPTPIGSYQTNIWMSGPKDLFSHLTSTLYHYDGANWISFPNISYTYLYGISGSGPSNVFAVGENKLILRYGP